MTDSGADVTTVHGAVASDLTTLGPLPQMGAMIFRRVEAHENGDS